MSPLQDALLKLGADEWRTGHGWRTPDSAVASSTSSGTNINEVGSASGEISISYSTHPSTIGAAATIAAQKVCPLASRIRCSMPGNLLGPYLSWYVSRIGIRLATRIDQAR